MDLNNFLEKHEQVPVEILPNNVPARPKVSVCVQTYQQENFIEKCLQGILMQKTDFKYEILLGEDESSDGTREICKKFAAEFPDKIKLILHRRENNIKINGKPTGRFNFMYNLLAAKGQYIALCEGDDFWSDSNKLQKQVDFLDSNDSFAMCSHNVELLFKGVKEHKVFNKSLKVSDFEDILNQGLFIPTPSIVYRRKLLPELPEWFANLWVGDYPLTLLLTDKGKNYYFEEIMGVKQKNPGGLTQNPEYKKSKEFIDRNKLFFYRSLNEYTAHRYLHSLQPIIIAFSFRVSKYDIKAGNLSKATKLFKTLLKSPSLSLRFLKKKFSSQ